MSGLKSKNRYTVRYCSTYNTFSFLSSVLGNVFCFLPTCCPSCVLPRRTRQVPRDSRRRRHRGRVALLGLLAFLLPGKERHLACGVGFFLALWERAKEEESAVGRVKAFFFFEITSRETLSSLRTSSFLLSFSSSFAISSHSFSCCHTWRRSGRGTPLPLFNPCFCH